MVALARGGALETVVDGVTGVLVEDESAGALAAGIRAAMDRPLDPVGIRRHAERFGRKRFEAEFLEAVDDLMSAPAGEAQW